MRLVTFALHKEISVTHVIPYVEPHSFTLRTDRPCVWLQKACLFVLKTLKAYNRGKRFHEQETMYYKQITINPDDFMRSMFEMTSELEQHYNRKPDTIFMGPAEFYNFRGQKCFQYLQFDARYFTKESQFHTATVHGIAIHVIPWMEGMLIL